MRRSKLNKNLGRAFRLRPSPVVLGEVVQVERSWTAAKDQRGQDPIAFHSSGVPALLLHFKEVHHYDEPDVLWLRSLFILKDQEWRTEPLARHIGHTNRREAFEIHTPDVISDVEWPSVHGGGAPPDKRILVLNVLVGGDCWLQPHEVEGGADGFWTHPGIQLRSKRDRTIYAIAVPATDVATLRSLCRGPIKSLVELERLLREHGIEYDLSKPTRLRRADSQ